MVIIFLKYRKFRVLVINMSHTSEKNLTVLVSRSTNKVALGVFLN
jgi:hypothetical protein